MRALFLGGREAGHGSRGAPAGAVVHPRTTLPAGERSGLVAGDVWVEPRTDGERVSSFREAWAGRRGDPEGTLATAERLRDEALADGDLVGFARALTLVASCHLLRNDYPAGLRAGYEALAHLDGGPLADRARALGEVATLEIQSGDLASGLERLDEARQLHATLGDRLAEATDLNRIGIAFYSRGELDDAADAYRRALDLLDVDGDTLTVAGTRNNLAKVLTSKGEHEAALGQLRLARAAFAEAGERRGLGMTFHNAAMVNDARGDRVAAEDQYRTAIEHYDAAGHAHGASESRTRLARHLAAAGATDEPLALLMRAHEDAERIGASDECLHASETLADVLEQRGDHAGALRWLRHAREVETAARSESADQRLRGLQVRFQLERLQRDSVTDPLTGLANRRGLDQKLASLEASPPAGDLGLLLFDLDDFKQVNDTFSHAVGDDVLRRVATVLVEGTRPTDLCVRFGGEEFVVVLPGCDLARTRRIGDELRRAVRAVPWDELATGLCVTASVGAAVRSAVPDPASLLLAADRAMYAAKHDGKDQVRA
jgi:diguanylate cyclase (GGDEF)-like protein